MLILVAVAACWSVERLAQDNPAHRQTIEDADEKPDRACREEREVRMTAQQILTDHLAPEGGDRARFWADLDLDLGGAALIDLKFHDCSLRNANFARARFLGQTSLLGIKFRGSTRFDGVPYTPPEWTQRPDRDDFD